MAAAKYKLKLEQGVTLRKPFTWRAAGVLVDLTGYKARMQIRPEVGSSAVLAGLTTENGGILIDDPASGTFVLYLDDVAMAALEFDEAVYDVELIAPNGDVIRVMQGVVTLSPEVTR